MPPFSVLQEKYLHLPSSSFISETGKAVTKDASAVAINTAMKAACIAKKFSRYASLQLYRCAHATGKSGGGRRLISRVSYLTS